MTSRDNTAKKNHLIDYKGMLNTIPDGEIKQLVAQEDGLVNDDFATKLDRIAGQGVEPDFVLPGKAGSLIARCTAAEAEKIYDAVFGMGVSRRQDLKMVQVRDLGIEGQKGPRDLVLISAFGNAASGAQPSKKLPLSPEFMAAALMPSAAEIVRPNFARPASMPMAQAA